MSPLHTLRSTRSLARAVLLWWCLALGLATAAPLAQAQGSRMVCSAAGMVMLVDAETGTPAKLGPHTLDCVLCLLTGAPPPSAPANRIAATPSQTGAGQASPSALAWRSAAPPPGRGPPSLT
ncbi:MAG: DUF2946 domain-containing protein [Rhodoferax sp.]|nr:DUF2946 domain-containing protein [Rhodoferax sp.]